MFVLTYGSDVQWLTYVLAAGSASRCGPAVEDFHLVEPELIVDPGLLLLPRFVRIFGTDQPGDRAAAHAGGVAKLSHSRGLGWHTPRMPLEEYRRKRDFGKTPEPAPAELAGTTGRFVVQRHRATRLHYDFRLEIDGVLVSWAVPKGPSLDCKIRRMAIHVEDHPIEYFDFEGVIPAKQYGAGDVIVWDWGTWEPEAPTLAAMKSVDDGELKFRLNGEKLKGRFTIVRTSRRPGAAPQRAFEKDEGEQWLLIHKCDEHAKPGWDAEDYPQERQDRPHQRRGQGQARGDLDQRVAGRDRRDRPRGREEGADAQAHRPDARDARDQGVR